MKREVSTEQMSAQRRIQAGKKLVLTAILRQSSSEELSVVEWLAALLEVQRWLIDEGLKGESSGGENASS
jgi:hypothetical protein